MIVRGRSSCCEVRTFERLSWCVEDFSSTQKDSCWKDVRVFFRIRLSLPAEEPAGTASTVTRPSLNLEPPPSIETWNR